MKKIITVQHTQSEQHTNGMIGSWGDWDLTDKGVSQAKNIGYKLRKDIGRETYLLYSSDLKRAAHTAKIISDALNVSPTYSRLLREIYLGEAVGKTKKWARTNQKCLVMPNTLDWAATKDGRVFEGAESRQDLRRRVSQFVDQIIVPAKENVIVVSHDGTLSILFSIWLGLDIDSLDHVRISGKAGGVSMLREDSDGNRIIEKLNDMSYAETPVEKIHIIPLNRKGKIGGVCNR